MWAFKKDIFKTENKIINLTPWMLNFGYSENSACYDPYIGPTNYYSDCTVLEPECIFYEDNMGITKVDTGYYSYNNMVFYISSNGSFQMINKCPCLDYLTSECTVGDVRIFRENFYDKTWMGCNLNVVKYANGENIPQAASVNDWIYYNQQGIGAWCYHPTDSANNVKYGLLYNEHAVNDSRGLLNGYHVPSYTEWNTLQQYLGTSVPQTYLKNECFWLFNFSNANKTGFGVLPTALRRSDGTYTIGGAYTPFTSSDYGLSTTIRAQGSLGVEFDRDGGSLIFNYNLDSGIGAPVRLIKNYN
jgi:uncharacterized protein (TIGR02145 family)